MTAKPVSGTKEWADGSGNLRECEHLCPHECHYCYARIKKPSEYVEPGLKITGVKNPNRIMFPTQHDITPQNIDRVLVALPEMLEQADNLLIVTKPHFECVEALCEFFYDYALNGPGPKPCSTLEALRYMQERVMFRFTIGSLDNEVLSFWEPGAPSYEERVASLILAHSRDFQTSVSCEPALNLPLEYPRLVETLGPWVTDAIWIGRMNNVHQRLTANGAPEDMVSKGLWLEGQWLAPAVMELYELLKDNPLVKWKDSIKEILCLDRPTTPGADR